MFEGFVFPMKVMSYNLRGFGGGEKRVEARKLVISQ